MIQKNKLFSDFLWYSCNIHMQQWLLGNLYMLLASLKFLFDHVTRRQVSVPNKTDKRKQQSMPYKHKSGFKKRQEQREQEKKVKRLPKLDTFEFFVNTRQRVDTLHVHLCMSQPLHHCQQGCVSKHAAGLFAFQLGEYKCFAKGFECILAAVPLFKRLLSFQSQVAAGHLFRCLRVFSWINCVHADWGGQFSGHGVVCWQVCCSCLSFLF